MATNENEQDLPDKSHNMTMYVDQELVDAVRYVPIDALKGYRRHARKHSKRQRRTMERMLREFGFLMPVLIDGECNVVAGHLRMAAANGLGYTKVPTIQVTHLTSEQVRALRIADNRLAELGEWDREALAREFQDLIEIDYDVEMTGFEAAEIDMVIEEFEAFLTDYIKNVVAYSEPGSVHYHFIDWRHLNVLERVCHKFYDAQLNLCVWVKSNGGMGSFYRSRHELVLVFRNGPGPHINNVKLGSFGRNRTNVWEYDGCSTGTKDRRTDLALHPTVKPAEMIADAIKDASKRGGLILDPFLGSGTTVIACEMTGRRCVGMELDPKYVDVIVRRWQAYTGGEAVHAETGLTFAQIGDMRAGKLLLAAPADGEA